MLTLTTAVRSLRGSPAFSAVVILTMAVAIAANAAIFSVHDRLVLHPVSIPDAGSLVAIWFNNPQRNIQTPSSSIPRYDELRGAIHTFSSIGLSAFDSFTLSGGGEATQLNGLRVSAGFLPTLGILPARGRNFTEAEDVANGPAVCILSHETWQAQFGGREAIVGQTIQLNGMAWEVIGVMPPRLTAPFGQVQVFAPRVFETGGLTPAQIQAGATFAQPIARLKPGATMEQARAELAAFSGGYQARHPTNVDANNVSEPRDFVGSLVSGFQPTMYTLLGAVACVLLIACANVASLFLSRLLNRRKEIAVRLSLGATRGAIVRQFLAESLLFSIAAGALGTLLAIWALSALQSIVATQLPPNTTLALNWRALVFTAGVSVACTILTGLFPALQASRPDLVEHLRDGARGSSTAQGHRPRQALIVAEVTLSVVLLVGAGLLLVSFVKLQGTAAGFDPGGSASAYVGLPPARYGTPAQQAQFFDQVVAALRAQPGVTDAAVAFSTPLTGGARTPYAIAGQPLPPLGQRPIVGLNIVSDGYFRLLRIPIAEGRGFTADDRAASTPVCLVNQTFARRVFPGRSAVGETLLLGAAARRVEIVGVIHDVKSAGVNAPTPDEAYFPLQQLGRPGLNVIARTAGDPAALQTAIRNAVAAVDTSQAISFFATTESNVAASLGTQKLVATLTGIFAALALLLSLTGLYSVLAYLVSQRTAEIGIRMALGATRTQVVRLVMRSGLSLVAVGLGLGLGGAAAAARVIRQLLFGVEPVNVVIYAAVSALFAVVAVLACLGPSLRASRIDPLVAFRAHL
jgi:predicted permease